MKNKGAIKLNKFSWIQNNGLDIAAFYIGFLFSFMIFWTVLIMIIVRKYRQKQEKGKFKYY